MLGGRQDHKLETAMELWWNRPIFAGYFGVRAAQEKYASKLRSTIESNLFSVEVAGSVAARIVLWDKIFELLR